MKTIRRDKLKRLAEADKLVVVDAYEFDDMLGASRVKEETKVRMAPKDGGERYLPGHITLDESDFKSSVGRAWENPNGTITLIVHSNLNYTFKVKS